MNIVSMLGLSMVLLPVAVSAQSVVPAAGGDITITPIQHAAVQVEYGGKVIQVDPAQGDFSKAKSADLVLVTDIHGDHLNTDFIAKVRKPGAPVVMPAAVQQQVGAKVPAPVELLDGVRETVSRLAGEYQLMLITKGDLFETTARRRAAKGERIIRLAPFNGGTDAFNALATIPHDSPGLVDSARAMADRQRGYKSCSAT